MSSTFSTVARWVAAIALGFALVAGGLFWLSPFIVPAVVLWWALRRGVSGVGLVLASVGAVWMLIYVPMFAIGCVAAGTDCAASPGAQPSLLVGVVVLASGIALLAWRSVLPVYRHRA